MQTNSLDVQFSGERYRFEVIEERFEIMKEIFCCSQCVDFRKGQIPSVCAFNKVQSAFYFIPDLYPVHL